MQHAHLHMDTKRTDCRSDCHSLPKPEVHAGQQVQEAAGRRREANAQRQDVINGLCGSC